MIRLNLIINFNDGHRWKSVVDCLSKFQQWKQPLFVCFSSRPRWQFPSSRSVNRVSLAVLMHFLVNFHGLSPCTGPSWPSQLMSAVDPSSTLNGCLVQLIASLKLQILVVLSWLLDFTHRTTWLRVFAFQSTVFARLFIQITYVIDCDDRVFAYRIWDNFFCNLTYIETRRTSWPWRFGVGELTMEFFSLCWPKLNFVFIRQVRLTQPISFNARITAIRLPVENAKPTGPG